MTHRLAAVLTTLALVLMTAVGSFILPIATKTEATAAAATEQPGSTSLTLGTVRGGIGSSYSNNSATGATGDTSTDCVSYYNNNTYSSTPVTVTASTTPLAASAWSYAGRGVPVGSSCYNAYPTNQSTLGFMPNNAGTVDAGSVFLVGRFRHNNFSIQTQDDYFHSSIYVEVNGTGDNFPFYQHDTPNTSVPTVLDHAGGNYTYVGAAGYSSLVGNGYGYSTQYNVNYWYGYYCPAGQEVAVYGSTWGCYRLTTGTGAYDLYTLSTQSSASGKIGAPNQTPSSDDVLTIQRTTSTNVVISKEGVPYRLTLWGFTTSADGTCPATVPSGAQPVNTFTTKEGKVSYGCLYGTFEQERYVTIAKEATADANSQDVTIPDFGFSVDAQAGAESISNGTPATGVVSALSPASEVTNFVSDNSFGYTVKPTALGSAGTDYYDGANGTRTGKIRYQAFLVGDGDFTINEKKPSPSSAGGTQSGWALTSVTCVNGEGDDVAVTHTATGVSFENVGVAPSVKAVPITCTFHNEYTAKSKLTLVKQLTHAPSGVTADKWTLSARGTTADTVTSSTIVAGRSGSSSVTSQVVPSGSYHLAEVVNPTGIAGFVRTRLTCVNNTTGASVAVSTADDVTLPDGADVTCTYTNDYRTGSLSVSKTLLDQDGKKIDLASDTDGYVGDGTFTLSWTCTGNGVTRTGTVDVTANGSAVTAADNLPIGLTCSVTEAADQLDQDDLADPSYSWLSYQSSAAVTITTGTTQTLAVTNQMHRDMGTLTIGKTVAPEDGLPAGAYVGGTNRTFPISYECTSAGDVVASGTVNVANSQTTDVAVPAPSECTINEDVPSTQSGDFSASYFTWSSSAPDQDFVDVGVDGTSTITEVNKYKIDTVPLTVGKKVVGPGGTIASPGTTGYKGTASDTFTITVTCPSIGTQTVTVANDATSTVQVPRGASCTVNEPNNATDYDDSRLAADFDWDPAATTYNGTDSGAVTVNDDAGKTVTVVNPTKLSYGGIAIAKAINPNDATGLAAKATFSFDVVCYAPGVDPTNPGTATPTYTTTATIGLTGIWRAPANTLQAESSCLVSEHDLTGTSTGFVNASYEWTGSSWAISFGQEHNGMTGTGSAVITAHARSTDADHPYPRVTFTNTYSRQTAALHVKKLLDLPDGATIDDHTYTGSFYCDLGGQSIQGTWTQTHDGTEADTGDASVTVTSDAQGLNTLNSASDTVTVYAGSWCQVTEDALTSAPSATDGHLVWGSSTSKYGTVTFTPDADGNLELDKTEVITNQVERTEANVVISKSVSGGVAGTQYSADQQFTFVYSCWTDSTKATEVASGKRTVTSGASADLPGLTLDPGTYCEVYEDLTAHEGLKDPWIWDPVTFSAGDQSVSRTGTTTDADGNTFNVYGFTVPDAGKNIVLSATNHLNNELVPLRVSKAITGSTAGYTGTAANGATQTFSVQVTCTSDDPSVAGYSGNLTISAPKGSDPSTAYAETAKVPVGQHCTVAENPPSGGLADASYEWGTPSVSAVTDAEDGTHVTVSRDSTAELRVTNTIQRAYGTIALVKSITGSTADGSALQGRDGTYSGSFTCTHDGDSAVTGTWTVTGPGTATVTVDGTDVSKDNTVLLLGSSCSPTETSLPDHPNDADLRYHWGKVGADAVTTDAVVSADATNDMTVANEVVRPVVATTISKDMSDTDLAALTAAGATQDFTIHGACAPTADMADVTVFTLNIKVNEAQDTEIPPGFYCQISEVIPDQSTLKDASYAWDNPTITVYDTSGGGRTALTAVDGTTNVYKVPDDATSVSVGVTNTVHRVTGSLSLTKAYGSQVQAAGVVDDGATFTGTYTCTYDGSTISTGTWTRTGTGAATFTPADGSAAVDSLPLTTSCTATEDAPDNDQLANVSWAWKTPAVTYGASGRATTATVASSTTPAVVTVTNDATRVYSTVRIQKDYVGDTAALDAGATVTGTLQCVGPDGSVVSISGPFNARGISNTDDGSAEMTLDPTDPNAPIKVLAGSDCRMVEDSLDNDPTTGPLADSSYKWGTPVYSYSEDGGATFTDASGNWYATTSGSQETILRVTNSTVRQWGNMTLTKVVPDSTTTSSNTYTGTWTCTYTPASGDPVVQTGTWSRSGDGVATIASDVDYDGNGLHDGHVLVGSVCSVAETARPDNPDATDVSYQWKTTIADVPVDATANVVTATSSRVASSTSNAALSVTNATERHYGSLAVRKAPLEGASDGADPDGLYYVAYTCVAGTGDEESTLSGYAAVTAGGDPVTVSTQIPVGSHCVVSEVPPGSQVAVGVTAPINLLDTTKFAWSTAVRYDASAAVTESDPGSIAFVLPSGESSTAVTNTVYPLAQVDKAFTGTTQHLVDGVWDGTWDVAYSITVSNPSSKAELQYSLTDTPTTPSGSDLKGVTVTYAGQQVDLTGQTVASGTALTIVPGLPEGTSREGDGNLVNADGSPYTDADGNQVKDPRATLEAGGSAVYTVVLNVAARDDGAAVARADDTSCAAITPGSDVSTIHNSTSATSNGVTRTDADCGEIPESPTFSVTKTSTGGADQATRNSDGTYTASYTVTVRNTSTTASALLAPLTDTPTLPAGATLTQATVSVDGATATDLGTSPAWTLAEAGTGDPAGTLAGGASRTYVVTLTFTVDGAATGYDPTTYTCAGSAADGYTAGIINTESMDGDTTTGDDAACQSLAPELSVAKTVTENGGLTGAATFTIDYDVTATNDGAIPQSTGVLADTPDFAPGLRINGVWASEDAGALGTDATKVSSDANGAYTLTDGLLVQPASYDAGGNVVPGSNTRTVHVRFQVTLDTTATGYTADALSCTSAADGVLTSGHGLYNAVAADAAVDHDGAGNNVACGPFGPRTITVHKTGAVDNASLSGSTFALYDTDPTAAGAEPVAGALTVNPDDGSLFTSSTLELGRTYWLVETKAPTGHELLAAPIAFTLSADADTDLTDVTLVDAAAQGAKVTAVNASSNAGVTTPATITVQDTETGTMPATGGPGIIPFALAAMGLVVVATGASLRRRRSGALV